MPSSSRKSSRSAKKSKSPKTRKNVVFSENNSVKRYSPASYSPLEYVPKCKKDEHGKIAEYPCKLKYAVFQNKQEYDDYMFLLHQRRLERDDYYNEVTNHYNELRKKIPLRERRKK